ncbi:MAG: hypothetical protein JWS11_1586 [Cypionkella sp.]|nr:hypothetical protein [Cypionkella sp.]
MVFLTYDEVCLVFHTHGLTDIDSDWVKRTAKLGSLPFVIVRGTRRFLRSEIDAYIKRLVTDASLAERSRIYGSASMRRRPARKTRFSK